MLSRLRFLSVLDASEHRLNARQSITDTGTNTSVSGRSFSNGHVSEQEVGAVAVFIVILAP